MKTNITLLIPGDARVCKVPFAHADHAIAEGACPTCKAEPFKVGGSGMRPSACDRYWEADGGCIGCKTFLGILRVDTGTLFGVREDRAVLEGRCRVY